MRFIQRTLTLTILHSESKARPHRFQHDPHSSTLRVSSVTYLPSGVSFDGALNSGGYTRKAPNSGLPFAKERRGSTLHTSDMCWIKEQRKGGYSGFHVKGRGGTKKQQISGLGSHETLGCTPQNTTGKVSSSPSHARFSREFSQVANRRGL